MSDTGSSEPLVFLSYSWLKAGDIPTSSVKVFINREELREFKVAIIDHQSTSLFSILIACSIGMLMVKIGGGEFLYAVHNVLMPNALQDEY